MGTNPKDDEERLLLSDALRMLQEQYSWVPVAALRVQVAEGIIPSVRSSLKKKARYYVKLSDLIAAMPVVDLPTLK
jgi:hypothetical protein